MSDDWQKIQLHLQQNLEPGQYKVWIAPLRAHLEPDSSGKRLLTIYAINEFVAEFVRARFFDVIAQSAAAVLKVPHVLAIVAGKNEIPESSTTDDLAVAPAAPDLPASSEKSRQASAARRVQPVETFDQYELPFALPSSVFGGEKSIARSWRYSFDDFVVGPDNELAFAAAQSICRNSSNADMLFLSSRPGLGKTHLTQAVGKEICSCSNHSQPRVEYLTAEEFCSRLFMAIRSQDTDRFKSRYRQVDVLLLEDIHFLQGKEKMQEELLATLKQLQDRGSKIVLSSSFMPRDMRDMNDALLSRLHSGFLAVIDRPGLATRKRIIENKAKLHQVLLPEDVTDFLAQSLDSDVRQIESCLKNLLLKAKLMNTAITLNMALEIMDAYGYSKKELDLDGIIGYVCQGYGFTSDQLRSKSRKRELVHARNTIFYLARKHTDLSLEQIGSRFNRSHSTVIKGITALEREISRESSAGRQMSNTISLIERNSGIIISASSDGGRV